MIKNHISTADSTGDWLQTALKLLETGNAACICIHDGKIIAQKAGRGVGPILQLYQENLLPQACIVDKVVGKAAAMVMTRGGIASCHAVVISKMALDWLQSRNIPVTYGSCVDYIINRNGDGMCPMEETVLSLTDDEEIISILQDKICQLQKS